MKPQFKVLKQKINPNPKPKLQNLNPKHKTLNLIQNFKSKALKP